MKGVVMLVNEFPPAPVGGAERQVERLAGYLAREGLDIQVITRSFAECPRVETRNGYRIIRIRQVGPGKMRTLSFVIGALLAILLRRNSFDVLHAHLAFSPAAVAALAGRLLGKAVVVKFGTGGASSEIAVSRKSWRGQLRLAILRRWVDVYVALTDEMKTELIQTGFDRSRIVRMSNGIDAAEFAPAEDREQAKAAVSFGGMVLVLFAGRLVAIKGLPILLQAFGTVVRDCDRVRLIVAGEGDQRAALESAVERQRLRPYVQFVGKVSDMGPYLRAADIFVLPSLGEGISNSLLEAMSAGLACIASRVGGAVELLDNGNCGILVAPNDAGQLAEALSTLVNQRQEVVRLGSLARERVLQLYDFSSVAAKYIELYDRLVHPRQL